MEFVRNSFDSKIDNSIDSKRQKKFEKFDNFQFEIRSIRKKKIRKIRKFFKFSFLIRIIRNHFLLNNILCIQSKVLALWEYCIENTSSIIMFSYILHVAYWTWLALAWISEFYINWKFQYLSLPSNYLSATTYNIFHIHRVKDIFFSQNIFKSSNIKTHLNFQITKHI